MFVTSVHTNIPHNEGIQATKEMLAIQTPYDLLHSSYIVELLEVVLTINSFELNGTHYHQVSGTAMGTKLAPSYAIFRKNMYIHIHYNLHIMEKSH